jgi:CheY-like chemotaxis protein
MSDPICVLLVEDDDSIRLTFRDYLEKKGYQVYVASDGVGAIKQMLDVSVDLIISDYRMDVLGGDYWVRFLERFCSDKKVLITSGFLPPDFPIKYEFIQKPFLFGEMDEKIKVLFS